MRLVEVGALLGFLAGCGAFVRALWARTRPVSEWAPYHRYEGESRRVYVRRGDELEPIGEVSSGDPAYDDAFLRLMGAARERAAILNSER